MSDKEYNASGQRNHSCCCHSGACRESSVDTSRTGIPDKIYMMIERYVVRFHAAVGLLVVEILTLHGAAQAQAIERMRLLV